MQLKKDTWHYRNWEYWLRTSYSTRADKYRDNPLRMYYHGGPRQANLCMYFWAAAFRAPCIKIVRNEKVHVATGIFLFYVMLAFIGTAAFAGTQFGTDPLFVLLIYPAIIALIGGICLGLILLVVWLLDKHQEISTPPSKKEPNILMEHIKAKKNRVCPIIEFVDE